MARAFVSIGSNIEPEANIEEALRRLARRVDVMGVSTFYRSEPVGPPGQPPFLNGVVEVRTELPPRELKFAALRRIERELGRVRTADRYAPRPIDLDLLIYDECVTASRELTLPDPDITSRPFLAVPLGELAPDLVLPGDGRTMGEVAAQLAGHGMSQAAAYTEKLRESVAHES
jgi:2-amino-4-hydroxy-6-hydroxymethyldihydropteridine diphosphokinase